MSALRSEDARLVGSFFADYLALLAFSDIQHALNGFADACDIAEMKISTSKPEVFHLCKNLVKRFLQVGGVSLKQVKKLKDIGVAFKSDGKQNEILDVPSGKQVLHYEFYTIQSSKNGSYRKKQSSCSLRRYSSPFSQMVRNLGK